MNRPELIRLLGDAVPGDVILIDQDERLTRLDDAGWEILRKQITDKQLAIVSLDLPTSHLALSSAVSDDFTRSMLKAAKLEEDICSLPMEKHMLYSKRTVIFWSYPSSSKRCLSSMIAFK